MKKSGLPPLWIVIVIVFIVGISELAIRVLTSSEDFLSIGNAALLLWGFIMFSGGLFSLISYFFEAKWKGFQGLIWVYKTIVPIGGKVNAIIFGLIGIAVGLASIARALAS